MAGDISKLRQLRTGDPIHGTVTLGNGDDAFKVAIVLLNSDTSRKIEELTEEYYQVNKTKVNNKIRAQYYNALLAYECLRDPNDINVRLASSAEEINELLDQEDIGRIHDKYNELFINKAPKLEFLTPEEFEQLKKALEVTSLSDLSTTSLIHLKSFLQTIVSES